MKKRILLFAVMVVSLCLMLAVGVSAAEPDNSGETITLSTGETVALYDTDGDPLCWYYNDSNVLTYIKAEDLGYEVVENASAGTKLLYSVWTGPNNTGLCLQTCDNTSVNKLVVADFRHLEITSISKDTLFKSSTVVEYVRFPDTLAEIKEFFFESATNLQRVYIPKTATNLTTIGRFAFKDCKKLTALYLPEGLITLGEKNNSSGVFQGCHSLYFVNDPDNTKKESVYYFPSSLTNLYGEVFKYCYSMNDVVVLGQNVKFSETDQNSGWMWSRRNDTDSDRLKQVKYVVYTSTEISHYTYANEEYNMLYIFSGVSSSDVKFNQKASNGNNTAAYFCVDDKWAYVNDATKGNFTAGKNLHIASPKLSTIEPATCYSNEKKVTKCFCDKLISEGETPNSKIDHEYVDNFDCTKGNECKNFKHCNASLEAEAFAHVEKHSVAYANGFSKAGVHSIWCDNENCSALDTDITIGAMISTSGGYSTNSNGGLAGGWTINTDLVILYNDYNENDVKFGIYMVNPTHLASNSFMVNYAPNLAEGKNGALVVDLTGDEHASFAFAINGFDTEALAKLELVITAYAYVDGSDVEFIQDANTVCKVTTLDYADGSLYTVSYEKATSELSPASVEAVLPTVKKDNF